MPHRLHAVLLLATLATAVVGQQPPQNVPPQPRLNSVFPVGAEVGSSVEVTVTGFDLDDPNGLHFSHPGFKAELIVPPDPPVDPKAKDKPKPKGPLSSHKFRVTVPADAPLGNHDVRVLTPLGVSNPRAFVVGDKPELNETDKPNDDVPQAQKIEPNTTVNGVISSSADVDYYSFIGSKGQRVLVHCRTASIDSRCRPLVEIFGSDGIRLGSDRNYKDSDALADVTLPTDGDYVVRVCEFAYQSGSPEHFYRLTVGTGPWIDAVFPPAVNPGKPTSVTVYGRNLPGGKPVPGSTLEQLAVTVTPPADPARDTLAVRGHLPPPLALQDGFEFRLPGSNAVTIGYTDAPVHLERQADNDKADAAEPVAAPCDVAGRIDRRYDRDWYSFTAKKGDVYYLELFADRTGAEMDTYFAVKNAANMADVLPEQDDEPDALHPQQFFTRTGDPAAARFVAPADGRYVVLVGSRESSVSYGPRCVYRLRIARPAPDFRAVVMPKSRDTVGAAVAETGGEVAFDVFVDRRDGFDGPVTATVEGLPSGITTAPTLIGTNNPWGTVVLSVAENAAPFNGPVTVKCTATVDNKPVTRLARPASITWSVQPGQNIPTVARLDRQLVLAVVPRKASLRIAVDLPQAKRKTKAADGKDQEVPLETPVFAKPGDRLTLPVKVLWQGEGNRPNPVNLRMEMIQPNIRQAAVGTQQGNENTPAVSIPKDKPDGPIAVDVRPNAPPGKYAVVIRGDTQVQIARDPMQKDNKANAVVQAFAAPLEVTVLPLALGRFSVQPPANNQLAAGTTSEITLKVERLHDYPGEFQVAVSLPKEAQGLTVKTVTLPAGATEVKIPVEVAADAKAGGSYQLTIVATATVHGRFPVTHEVKVSNLRIVPRPPKKDEKK